MSIKSIRAALESALDAMAGMIPAVAISSSSADSPAVFTTAVPHLLVSGVNVTISGHATLNGAYTVVVTGASTFTLTHTATSAAIVGAAMGSGSTVRANLTAWENTAFTPVPGVAWQRVHLLWAPPDDITLGHGYRRESGIMQVTLAYPLELGVGTIETRAELIKSTFPRGSSFSSGGIVVNIDRTPEIRGAIPYEESYRSPISVSYWANIFS